MCGSESMGKLGAGSRLYLTLQTSYRIAVTNFGDDIRLTLHGTLPLMHRLLLT
jgi:hypothetical protein